MNRVTCHQCSELVLQSPATAERLEGLVLQCPHCDVLGRIVVREDDAGPSAIELVALDSKKRAAKPCASREHIEDLDRPGHCLWCGLPMPPRK